jgi:hypothetical protein
MLAENVKVKIYRSIILPVILHGCETWSLILGKEDRVRVCENRVLRRIVGPKRDELIGGWRKLHNEDLHNLYSSPNIIRMINSRSMRWAGHVACMETHSQSSPYRTLVRKSEGKGPLGSPRRRREDNIQITLKK